MSKRKKYRPRDLPPLPLAFGLTPRARTELCLMERAALDALLQHEASDAQYETLVAALQASALSIDAAVMCPNQHDFTAESLRDARATLLTAAQALVQVGERAQRLGTFGCSGPEREALQAMLGHIDELREQLPRRFLHAGYAAAVRGQTVIVPTEAAHAA